MRELSKSIGVDPAIMSRMVAGIKEFPVLRRKVDLFFGEALLTPAFEFCHWNMVKEAIGIDPVISTMPALRRRAMELGVATKKATREELVAKMVGAAASLTKSERDQQSPKKSKIRLGEVGPIHGIPSPARPRRSAAKGQSETIHTKIQTSSQ